MEIKMKIYSKRKITKKTKQILEKIIFFVKKSFLKIKSIILRLFRDVFRNNLYNSREKRVLIFNIYEGKNSLQQYKLIFLEALVKIVDEVLIVVNGDLSKSDIKRLESIGKVLLRENKGYDVAAFRAGILSLGKEKIKEFDQLLLVNDTNIGPFIDLE
ncbi:rhamnan synthesis F family protein, partial [Streptococcus uberis]